MSNTRIQLKRSTTTVQPNNGTLTAAEPAYSFLSDKLFIGDSTGSGVIAIGGKFYTDQQNIIFQVANAAFAAANSAGSVEGIQTIYNQANAAFEVANLAYGQANAAFNRANSANVIASGAFDKANSANVLAKAAYDSSNTKVSKSGDTITGDLAIVGNLTVSGNTSYISVQNYKVDDPLIYLAGNNYISDIVDIGFIGNYVNATGSNVHTGIFREHSNKEYYVFQGYDQEPINNHIDPNGNNFTLAVLNAHIRTSNLNLGGANAIVWISAAFDKANSVATSANSYADSVGAAANTNAANATYLTVGTVPSGRLSGSYTGITGVGTLTAGTWNADVITVPYGGTGKTSFTTNGVLFGNSSGPISVTSAGIEGQVLQASSTGVPQFGMLDGGSF